MMSLLSRGLQILDESPEEPNGKPEEDKNAEAELEEAKKVDSEEAEKAKKPEEISKESAPHDTKSEETPNYVSDEEFQRASKELRKSNKRLKRNNEGLSTQLETTKETASRVPELEEQVKELQCEKDNLELAGKYGVSPSLLGPVNLDKEGKEQWLIDHLEEAHQDSEPAEKPKEKIKEKSEPEKDALVGEKPKPGSIPDVDADRPPAKPDPEMPDLDSMTNDEQKAYWKSKI